MAVLVEQSPGAAPVTADEIAAKALATVLARENAEDMAVASSPAGDHVVLPYGAWRTSVTLGERSGWQLAGVARKAE